MGFRLKLVRDVFLHLSDTLNNPCSSFLPRHFVSYVAAISCYREGGVAARLRACQAVLAAIDPLPAPGAPFELDLTATDSAVRPGLLKVVPAGSSANGEGVPCSAKDAVCKDETTLVFVARQLRHLMDHASGQSGEVWFGSEPIPHTSMDTIRDLPLDRVFDP